MTTKSGDKREAAVEPPRNVAKVAVTHPDGTTTPGYENSKVVTVSKVLCYFVKERKFYVACMQYGDKYEGSKCHLAYGLPGGHLMLDEGTSGVIKVGDKLFGGAAERELQEETKIDLYKLVADPATRTHFDGFENKICRASRTIIPGNPMQDVVLSYTYLFSWLGESMPAIGAPEPYGDRSVTPDGRTVFEIKSAAWVPLHDILTNVIQLAHGQNGLISILILDEIGHLYFTEHDPPGFHETLHNMFCEARAVRDARKK
jgi:hypothetical protein